MSTWTDEKIITLIRSRLDDYRFNHSLNVADSAKELAIRYGGDADKAYTAGLLHDVMKNASEEEQLGVLSEAGIELMPVERANKKLWHAMAGAAYIKFVMGIDDREIIRAVRYHTTGRAGMSLLEKINDMGTTILVVTHERELVNRFGKRVVAIESGRIISDAAGGYYGNGR